MKKLITLLFTIIISLTGFGQVNYVDDCSSLSGWGGSGFSTSSNDPCSGTSFRENVYGTTPIGDLHNTTSFGTSFGGEMTVQFDYKVIDYSGGAATSASSFNMVVKSALSSVGPWSTVYVVPHTASISCATKYFTYTPPAGNTVFLKFETTRSAGDYWVYYDDISIVESLCNSPVANYTVVPNCGSNQFSIDVDVTSLGDASAVNITDGTTTYENNVGIGTYTAGPFAVSSNQNIEVNGVSYGGCDISSASLTEACTCSSAPIATVNSTNLDCGISTYDIQVTVDDDGSGDVNLTDIKIDGVVVQADATTSSMYTFTVSTGSHTVSLEAEGVGFVSCSSIDYVEKEVCSNDICTDAIDILGETASVQLTTATADGDLSSISMGNGSYFTYCSTTPSHSAYYNSDYADLWYSIDIPDGSSEFTVTVSGSSCDIVILPYTGVCGSLTLMDISGSSSSNSITNGDEPFISGNGSFRFFDDGQSDISDASTGVIYLRIMAHDNSTGSSSDWCANVNLCDFNIIATSPQPNDDCSSALDITTNNGGSPSTGDLSLAASEGNNEWNCAGSLTGNSDLWYEVNYPDYPSDIVEFTTDITINGTAGQSVRINVYDVTAACGSTSNYSSVDYCEEITLTGGDDLTNLGGMLSNDGFDRFIQIIPIGTAGSYTISAVVTPENNTCEQFTNPLPGYNLENSTETLDFNYATDSDGSGNKDVWFQLDHNSNQSVTFSIDDANLWDGEVSIILYEYPSFSSLDCANLVEYCREDNVSDFNFETGVTFGLPTTDLLVRIVETTTDAGGDQLLANLSGAVSVNTILPNSECSGALDITAGSQTGNLTQAAIPCPLQGLTDCNGNGIGSTIFDDHYGAMQWYSFTMPNAVCPGLSTSTIVTEATIGLSGLTTNSGAGTKNVYVQLWSELSGNCNALVDCGTANNSSDITFNGLTEGETYFVQIINNTLSSTGSADFTVEQVVFADPAPCNDEQSGVVDLGTIFTGTDRSNCPSATYSAQGATSSGVNPDGWGDVWLTFVAPDNGGPYVQQEGYVTVYLDAISGSTMKVQIYDTTGTVELATATTNSEDDAWAHAGHLTPGGTYYVRIAHNQLTAAAVDYRLCFYQSDVIDGCPLTGTNESLGGIECGNDCSLFYKIDLPEETPSGYYRFEVIGDGVDIGARLRVQGMDSPSNEGSLTDIDHPCNAAGNVGQLSTGPLTDPGSCNGGSGEWDVYNLIGPSSGMRNYYYLEVYDQVSLLGCGGLDVCEVKIYGPFSTQSLAENPSNTVPDGLCSSVGSSCSATISAGASTCLNSSSNDITITFSGTGPTFDFVYAIDGVDQPQINNVSNPYTFTPSVGGTYTLTSFVDDGDASCAQTVSGSVTITATAGAPTITETEQEFCASENATVADLLPAAYWYLSDGSGNATGSVLANTIALDSGLTYVAVDSLGTCESAVSSEVTVSIYNPVTPTITETEQEFCASENATVADLLPAAYWYLSDGSGNATGNVLANTTALDSGLTYVAVDSLGICESAVSSEITISIYNPVTPTITETEQEFCLSENATVADLLPAAYWYLSDGSGNATGSVLANTIALDSGLTYVAVDSLGTCESAVSSEVTVSIYSPVTPTITETEQEFCASENATVADLLPAAYWYLSDGSGNATGSVLVATTALDSGLTYVAVDSLGTCESAVSSEVTVSIYNPVTPTITETEQEFCASENATVADLLPAAYWYLSDGSGNATGSVLANTTALDSGLTYVAVDSLGTCESAVSSEVTVSIYNPVTPTITEIEQEFCASENATVADLLPAAYWYLSDGSGNATGNVLANTIALDSGLTYVAVDSLGICESAVSSEVTVSIYNPVTPTITETEQEFCASENATVADLLPAAYWYLSDGSGNATGNVLVATTALDSGLTYVAVDSLGTCESAVSSEVTVSIYSPVTPTITETEQEFCASENATVADLLPAAYWYLSDGSGNATGSVLVATTALDSGLTYVAVDSLGICESAVSSEVTVSIYNPVTPTITETEQEFCASENATVADLLPAAYWYLSDGSGNATGNVLVATTALDSGLTYVAVDSLGICESAVSSEVTVSIYSPVTPTITETEQEFCASENATVGDLLPSGLYWYLSDGSGNATGNVLANTIALDSGLTYVAVDSLGICESAVSSEVTVSIQDAANAGLDGVLSVCAGTIPTDSILFASLVGFPDPGGVWTNLDTVYTYTVAATSPCTDPATSTVTVTEQGELSAGLDGTLTMCSGTTPTEAELFAALNGTPTVGGVWANVGLTYTYTMASTPCTIIDSAKVVVTEESQPNAGLDTSLTVCVGIVPTEAELFAVLPGTPDTGGVWTNVGLVYTYTVAATSPCTGPATSTVTVVEQAQSNAGLDGVLSVCAGAIPTDSALFASLVGFPDTGGVWTNVDLVYTYTVAATSPCTDPATSTVTVTEQGELSAGLDGTLTMCSGTTPTEAELFAALNGTPTAGGVWANVGLTYTYTMASTPCTIIDSAKVVVTEQVQPNAGLDTSLTVCVGIVPTEAELFAVLPGTPDTGGVWTNVGLIYTYTVAATSPCTDPATSTVTLTEQGELSAGLDGTLTMCSGTTPTEAELFAALNGTPTAGGVWANVGLTYTYTMASTPCTIIDSAKVVVTEQVQPNAGLDTSLTVCVGIVPTEAELFAVLPGTPDTGGVWTSVGLIYTYTVAATSPCSNAATSTVTLIEQDGANAGISGSLTLCLGAMPTEAELFDALSGTPDTGGVWTNIDLVYTYTVVATSPCTSEATSTVTISFREIEANDDFATTEQEVAVQIDPLVNDLGASSITILGGPSNGVATGSVLYAPNTGFFGRDTIVYEICDVLCLNRCDTAQIVIDVTELRPIKIFDGFSPNGDGVNETFIIENIEMYPLNEVVIYSRWGDLVYRAAPYMNEWDGTSKVNGVKLEGNKVVGGTYYFILKLTPESEPINGFIDLRR